MSINTIEAAPDSPLNLIYGENPLLSPVGSRIPFRSLASKLESQTLSHFDLHQFDSTAREELLVLRQQNFVPTEAAIDIAAALQNLLREYYWQRHPHNPAVLRDRAEIAQIAQLLRSKNFAPDSVPWLKTSASGMIIKGITGTGKSAVTTRYTKLLNDQVYVHDKGEIPGFAYVKQIVWLSVDMSADGSRDGFLTSILLEIDRLIGTTYAKQYSGRYSVDKLAIMVGVILSTHLCGMLIIDEIQEKNFNNSKWRTHLTTFFLRILNFGIPLVLIGNPLGFPALEKSSQNERRLSSGGVFEMIPYLTEGDVDLRNLVNQTLLFNVMNNRNKDATDYFRQVAYAYSGGIIDFVVRLNVESQRISLHAGESEVLPKHIDAAFSSPQIAPNHKLIRGLANKNQNLLRELVDIPVDRFVEIWKQLDKRETAGTAAPSPASAISSDSEVGVTKHNKGEAMEMTRQSPEVDAKPTSSSKVGPALAKQLKAKQSREASRRQQAADKMKLLTSDDIRGRGSSASLVDSLKDLIHNKKQP